MYYLDRFGDAGYPELEYINEQGHPETNELKKNTFTNIFRSATKDSLDAVGWGLAYLDFWRFIGLPFLILPKFDCGTAVETDWRGELKEPPRRTNLITRLKQIFGNEPTKAGKTLATWRKQIFDGKIPIPIFNSIVVETGERFLITPMTFGEVTAKRAVDFNTLYKGCDLDIVTAARLSATFPYVSPICRGDRKEITNKNYHFADGGYFDNSGFVTAVQWLDERIGEWRKIENLNIRRVIVLQINAFPESPSTEKAQYNGGWFMATLGPLLAMFKVRDPVLASRNAREAKLLMERWGKQVEREKQVDIQYFPIFFPSESEALPDSAISKLYQDGKYRPPLSWRLTDKEKQAIKDGWYAIKDGKNIQDIKRLWDKIFTLPKD